MMGSCYKQGGLGANEDSIICCALVGSCPLAWCFLRRLRRWTFPFWLGRRSLQRCQSTSSAHGRPRFCNPTRCAPATGSRATCKSLSTACLADCNGVRRTNSAGAASEMSGWQLLVQGSWQSPADLIHAFLQFSLHAELAAAAARAMSFRAAFLTRGSRRLHI